VAKRGEEGSLTSERDGKILARQRQADSNIAKEHSREPGQDAQRIRPSTTSRQAPYATAPRYALDLEAHGGLRRKLRASQAGLIAVGEPTIEKALDKALTKADKVVKRNVDATTDEITSELQEALKS
jgi:hypothetical protein